MNSACTPGLSCLAGQQFCSFKTPLSIAYFRGPCPPGCQCFLVLVPRAVQSLPPNAPLGSSCTAFSPKLGACHAQDSCLLTAISLPSNMVLVPARYSNDTGAINLTGKDTGAQKVQETVLNTAYLVRNPVGVSLLSLSPGLSACFGVSAPFTAHKTLPFPELHFLSAKVSLPSPDPLHQLPSSQGRAGLLESLGLE